MQHRPQAAILPVLRKLPGPLLDPLEPRPGHGGIHEKRGAGTPPVQHHGIESTGLAPLYAALFGPTGKSPERRDVAGGKSMFSMPLPGAKREKGRSAVGHSRRLLVPGRPPAANVESWAGDDPSDGDDTPRPYHLFRQRHDG